MSAPLVSVVIPTYNAPHFLLKTLGTVFAQTFQDYEVVVIDDGSTDDTVQQLQPHRDRIRMITQPNAGIGAARNRGIDESRGKYVALLDHDDLWMPEKLEAQTEFMQSHPQCSACSVPWSWSNQPELPTFQKSEICDVDGIVRRPLYELGHNHLFLISSSIMFDRERAIGLRYETRPKCIEDTPFQVGLIERGYFGIAGEKILMVYLQHTQNYSNQAAFFYNGQRMLREYTRNGKFDKLRPRDKSDLADFLAHVGRVTAAKQLMGGYRLKGLHVYLWELPHQLAQARMKFILTYPILLISPMSVVKRVFRGTSV